jgi:hypothetical protein
VIPLSGPIDCDAVVLLASLPAPATADEALAAQAAVGACRRTSPVYPPPAQAGYELALVAGIEALEAGDPATALRIGATVYAFGAAIAPASLGELETGLSTQLAALELLTAAGATRADLGPVEAVWRFDPGPAASFVGEAGLVRQMLAVEVLSRRDRRSCEAYADWSERLGRANLGLPHEVQLRQIERASAPDAPEPRACAAGLAVDQARRAALAEAVRARVVALTLPTP